MPEKIKVVSIWRDLKHYPGLRVWSEIQTVHLREFERQNGSSEVWYYIRIEEVPEALAAVVIYILKNGKTYPRWIPYETP